MSAQKNVFAIDVARASLIPNISAGIFAVAPSDNKNLCLRLLELILLVQGNTEFGLSVKI